MTTTDPRIAKRLERDRLRAEEDAQAIAYAKAHPVSDEERSHLHSLMASLPGMRES